MRRRRQFALQLLGVIFRGKLLGSRLNLWIALVGGLLGWCGGNGPSTLGCPLVVQLDKEASTLPLAETQACFVSLGDSMNCGAFFHVISTT